MYDEWQGATYYLVTEFKPFHEILKLGKSWDFPSSELYWSQKNSTLFNNVHGRSKHRVYAVHLLRNAIISDSVHLHFINNN